MVRFNVPDMTCGGCAQRIAGQAPTPTAGIGTQGQISELQGRAVADSGDDNLMQHEVGSP